MNPTRFSLKRHKAIVSPLAMFIAAVLSAGLRSDAQGTPDIVWVTNAQSFIYSVNFSANSLFLASASDDTTVKVWSVTDRVLLRAFDVGGAAALSVALSPDGSHVAAGDGDGQSRLWRMSDGVRLWLAGSANYLIQAAAFSSDGLRFADASWNTDIIVRDPLTGAGVRFSGHSAEVTSVTFSPDSLRLASASLDQSARLWRVADRSTLQVLVGHSNAVNSVDFSPDGALLATASSDGTARLWRVADGSQVRVLEGGGGTAARFSADGQLLLTVNTGTIHVWRVADGHQLHSYTNAQAGPLAVASNGKYFAYGRADGAVVLARLPLWFSEVRYGDSAVTLRWQGGSGRYQLQGRSTLTSGEWQNLGPPTTNTTVTHSCLSPIFYRVQSLPNP